MPGLSVEVRPMNADEATKVACLHAQGIPQGFLSRLGDGFRATLYRGIAAASRSGVWVAVTGDGEVVGFISGTAHVGDCYRSVLRRRGAALAARAAPSLLRPATWRYAYETLTYPRREVARPDRDRGDARPSAELLSIVVAPYGRGTGAAAGLVAALESALLSWQGPGSYRVVTMAADPRSNGFYEKVGFVHVREFRHHGIAMNLYHKELTRP